MAAQPLWTIDAYEAESGAKPAWSFIEGLEGRDKVEALALVKLLEEKGNTLRRPHSGALAEGLFAQKEVARRGPAATKQEKRH
jgi:hypothetical protein